MKRIRIIAGVVVVFITTPIWFYLLYRILDAVSATELMWFLYWVYVPVNLAVSITVKLTEKD